MSCPFPLGTISFIFTSFVVLALGRRTSPRTKINSVDPDSALRFFRVCGDLKKLKRTGWVNNQVAEPESVADHMYRMTMLSFLVKDSKIDRNRLMKICLVHDLAEAIVGDIVPHDKKIGKEQKREMEEKALYQITSDLGDQEIANEISDLWLEYENGSSPEARVAKNLDKFEMILQADEYERDQPGQELSDFFASTKNSFDHPEVAEWNQLLRKNRDARRKN
jgi:putative hydrolases of HD superfamily